MKEAREFTTETKFFTIGRERFLHLHPIGDRTLLLKGHLSGTPEDQGTYLSSELMTVLWQTLSNHVPHTAVYTRTLLAIRQGILLKKQMFS